MTTTTAPLLTYDQVDFDGTLSWALVVNWHYQASPFELLGRSNQLVLLPQTSQGQTWLPICNFTTAMRLLLRMRQDRVMSMTIGLEGQVTCTAVSWTKLIFWDSFDPYLTRLMTVYIPFTAGRRPSG